MTNDTKSNSDYVTPGQKLGLIEDYNTGTY